MEIVPFKYCYHEMSKTCQLEKDLREQDDLLAQLSVASCIGMNKSKKVRTFYHVDNCQQ